MNIREAEDFDIKHILAVEEAAFETNEEAELVDSLLNDQSAKPLLSLVASQHNEIVGHILFTKARIEPQTNINVSMSSLDPKNKELEAN